MSEQIILTEIPEHPAGFTRHMVLHLNYGPKGGAATYEIRDPKGRVTNIGYAYDTRKTKAHPRGTSGFFVCSSEGGSELMSWHKLRQRYADLIKPKAGSAHDGRAKP